MEIKKIIEDHINNNDVCLFMKGTPSRLNVDFQWQYQTF